MISISCQSPTLCEPVSELSAILHWSASSSLNRMGVPHDLTLNSFKMSPLLIISFRSALATLGPILPQLNFRIIFSSSKKKKKERNILMDFQWNFIHSVDQIRKNWQLSDNQLSWWYFFPFIYALKTSLNTIPLVFTTFHYIYSWVIYILQCNCQCYLPFNCIF